MYVACVGAVVVGEKCMDEEGANERREGSEDRLGIGDAKTRKEE
jgi:hypothetical protein